MLVCTVYVNPTWWSCKKTCYYYICVVSHRYFGADVSRFVAIPSSMEKYHRLTIRCLYLTRLLWLAEFKFTYAVTIVDSGPTTIINIVKNGKRSDLQALIFGSICR